MCKNHDEIITVKALGKIGVVKSQNKACKKSSGFVGLSTIIVFMKAPDENQALAFEDPKSSALNLIAKAVMDRVVTVFRQLGDRFESPEDRDSLHLVATHEAGHLLMAVILEIDCFEASISRMPLILREFLRKKFHINSALGKVAILPLKAPLNRESLCDHLLMNLSGSVAELVLEGNQALPNNLQAFIRGHIGIGGIQSDFRSGIENITVIVQEEFRQNLSPRLAAEVLLLLHRVLETEVFSHPDFQRAVASLRDKLKREKVFHHPDFAPLGAHPSINDLTAEHLQSAGVSIAELRAHLRRLDLMEMIGYYLPTIFGLNL